MLDTPISAQAVRPSLQGLHQQSALIDSFSDLGFSVPLSAIAMAPTDRRTVLKAATLPCLAVCAAACLRGTPAFGLATSSGAEDDARFRVEARFYEKLPGKNVRCKLCPRGCVVGDRERGHCRIRENRGGTYYTLVHSRVCAAHVDPIEKKPLFHYLPGTVAFSLATAGCNVN